MMKRNMVMVPSTSLFFRTSTTPKPAGEDTRPHRLKKEARHVRSNPAQAGHCAIYLLCERYQGGSLNKSVPEEPCK